MTLLRCTTKVFFTLFLFTLLPACSTEDRNESAPAADLVILGGVLLDMVAEQPNPTAIKALVIRDGRIDRIIPADSSEAVPRSANTINADSNYILPGFFDAHVHFRPFLSDARIWKRASNYYGIAPSLQSPAAKIPSTEVSAKPVV